MIRLEQLRIDKGYTPQKLAEKAGVNYQTVLNLEDGKTARVGTLHKLARALDATPSELLMPAVPPAPPTFRERRMPTRAHDGEVQAT